MPRYFFNLHNGSAAFDSEGVQLESHHEIHLYMLAMATELLRSPMHELRSIHMEVLDERGQIVRSLTVKTTAG